MGGTADVARINTYIGASCMLIMLEAIWPSLRSYPNTLPESAGLTSNKLIAYFVFWICKCPIVSTSNPADVYSTTPFGLDPSPQDALALLRQIRRRNHRCFRLARLGGAYCWRRWSCL